MQKSRTGNVIMNSGASLLYKMAHIVVQFALRTAFIRILGKEYTGVSTLFADILQVLSLMDLGMATAMAFSLYKPVAEKDAPKINALMNFYKQAYILIGCLVFSVGLLITPFLSYLVKDVPNIHEDIRLIYVIYVLTSASSYFFVYRTIVLRANQESRIISIVRTCSYVIEGTLEVILLIVLKEYFAYLITHFAFTLSTNILLSFITKTRYSHYFIDKTAKPSKTETRLMFKDIFALAIYKIAGVIIYSTDSIVISAFIGTSQVAVIGNFNLIINSLRNGIEQIVDSVKAGVGNLAATSSDEKQEKVFNRMNFISFWVACFSCTCLFVLLNPFIGDIWFDINYKVSQSIVAVLAANFYIAIMVYPVETFRTANGLFVQGKYRPAIMAVLNIILDIIFVRFWGIFGVLIATTISRLATQVWFDPYLVYKYVFKKSVARYLTDYTIKVAITIGCCLLSWFASSAIKVSNLYGSFLIKMGIAVLVPNFVLYVTYHNTQEFASIILFLRKVLNRILRK